MHEVTDSYKICTKCGDSYLPKSYNYCPNCGSGDLEIVTEKLEF